MKTVWCDECEGLSDVVEESVETTAWPQPERDYWVRRLDCGHELAYEVDFEPCLCDTPFTCLGRHDGSDS